MRTGKIIAAGEKAVERTENVTSLPQWLSVPILPAKPCHPFENNAGEPLRVHHLRRGHNDSPHAVVGADIYLVSSGNLISYVNNIPRSVNRRVELKTIVKWFWKNGSQSAAD